MYPASSWILLRQNERERGETNCSQGRKPVVGHGKFDAGVNGLTDNANYQNTSFGTV